MIVVSNTTPLNYLILIESTHVLPRFRPSVCSVRGDRGVSHPRSPETVRTSASTPPVWITIQDPTHAGPSKLGRGETAAIALALELQADRLLIDDRDGTKQAVRSGLQVVGTLGILEESS